MYRLRSYYVGNVLPHACMLSDNLAKAFYAWIQVRNIGAVAKGDEDKARLHHEMALKTKTFKAWFCSQVQ